MIRTPARLVMFALAFGFAGLITPDTSMRAAQPAIAEAVVVGPPTTLGLGTILADYSYFAGQLIRIPTARIRDVLSPRVFTVEPSTMPRSYMSSNSRALVVIDKPGLELKEGLVVEIIGRPWTFDGARSRIAGSWLDDLDARERKRSATRAVIRADIIRPPGVDFVARR